MNNIENFYNSNLLRERKAIDNQIALFNKVATRVAQEPTSAQGNLLPHLALKVAKLNLAQTAVEDELNQCITELKELIDELIGAGCESANFVEAILKRWKTDGRNSKRANTKQQTAPVDKFRKAYQQVTK